MKRRLKNIAKDYFFINIGLVIGAVGIRVFLVPGKIAAGGVSGIATILYHLFGTQVGFAMLLMNIPLFILGLKVFGKSYGFKTLYGTIMLSVFIDAIGYLIPNVDTLIDYTRGGNMMLAPIFGGVITGIGIGLIMKFGGSTGGTDILAQVINKFLHIPIGYGIMIVDFFVILGAAKFFGLEEALYALLSLYATAIFIDKVIEGVSYSKMVYIISDEYEKIREVILEDLSRGGTGISANGLYTNESKKMIMTVIHNKEIHELTEYIKEIDKNAFVIVSEVYEVFGEGFTPIEK